MCISLNTEFPDTFYFIPHFGDVISFISNPQFKNKTFFIICILCHLYYVLWKQCISLLFYDLLPCINSSLLWSEWACFLCVLHYLVYLLFLYSLFLLGRWAGGFATLSPSLEFKIYVMVIIWYWCLGYQINVFPFVFIFRVDTDYSAFKLVNPFLYSLQPGIYSI